MGRHARKGARLWLLLLRLLVLLLLLLLLSRRGVSPH